MSNLLAESLSLPNTKSLRSSRALLSLYFLYSGSSITLWTVHIPYFVAEFGITAFQVSALILLMGVGALFATQLLGRIADLRGSKSVLMGSVFANLVVFCAIGIAPSYAYLLFIAIFVGAAIGTMDFSMNAQAVDAEVAYGRPIFSSFHAFWSLGGMLGAAVAGTTLGFAWPIWVIFTTWGVLALPLFLFSGRLLFHEPKPSIDHLSKAEKRAKNKAEDALNRPFLKLIVLLGLMSGSGALMEGLGIDWSALFLSQDLGATVSQASISVAVFSGAMAAFRAVADKVLARIGRVNLIRVEAVTAAVGVAVAVLAPNVAISLIGWLLAGLGVSSIVPQLFAYSATVGAETHSGRNMARVFGFTYAVMLGGPALIGWLASTFGLRYSLSIGVLLGLAIFAATWVLSKAAKSNS